MSDRGPFRRWHARGSRSRGPGHSQKKTTFPYGVLGHLGVSESKFQTNGPLQRILTLDAEKKRNRIFGAKGTSSGKSTLTL